MLKAIFVALYLFVCSVAFAQDSQPATTLLSDSAGTSAAARSAWGFNVKSNFDGPTFSQVDGRRGPGAALNWKNSLRLGYALTHGMRVEIVPIVQFRSGNPARSEQFELIDPYLAWKQADVLSTKQRGYDLAFEGRYYLPVSAENKRELGSVRDKGNGRALGRLIYTQSLGKAPLEVVSDLNYFHHFPQKTTPKTILGVIEVYNFLNWKTGTAWTPYLSYKNIVQRFHNGRGDPWTKAHTIGLGSRWQANPNLSIDPALDWPFALKDTQFRVEAIYRFI